MNQIIEAKDLQKKKKKKKKKMKRQSILHKAADWHCEHCFFYCN
jgi:hypothetical protein